MSQPVPSKEFEKERDSLFKKLEEIEYLDAITSSLLLDNMREVMNALERVEHDKAVKYLRKCRQIIEKYESEA